MSTPQYTLDNVCGPCVISIIMNVSLRPRVHYFGEVAADQFAIDRQELHSVESERIAKVMVRIWNRGDTLEIGSYVAKPAFITIQGTRLCDVHLMQIGDRKR